MKPIAKSILLVGAGQLGSRYLQGLAQCKLPLKIYVQDIHAESLLRTEKRWQEVVDSSSGHEVIFSQTLDCVAQSVELAIVATTADVRPRLIRDILKFSTVRHWVLEKVLAQSELGLDEIQASIMNHSKAWVNTPRRLMPWYQQVKVRLGLFQTMTLKVEGGSWGLACNAVHFLDLLAWWTGETLQQVNTVALDSEWFKSKRPGNWEIGGTLSAQFSGGSQALLTANAGGGAYRIHVSDGMQSWVIDEAEGVARHSNGVSITGRLLLQSEMTATLVEKIIMTGQCDLPTLGESISLHRVFIRSMQEHWRRSGNADANTIPIT